MYKKDSEVYNKYKQQQLNVYKNSKPIKNWREQMKGARSNEELLRLAGEVKIGPGGTALDVGAGEGYHTEDLLNMGWNAWGIELSEKRVKDAHSFGRNYVQQGDMHFLPFPPATFSLVFAHEVIEHCADIDKVLEGIKRVLIPNGSFVFSCPLEAHWKEKKQEKDLIESHDFSTADNHFLKTSAPYLYNLLVQYGFVDIDFRLYTLQGIQYQFSFTPDNPKKINFNPHAHVVCKKGK